MFIIFGQKYNAHEAVNKADNIDIVSKYILLFFW